MEGFDVFGKILSVLEVKFILPTFLGRARSDESLCGCVAKNGSAELFVHQDTGLFLWNASANSCLKTVVDHLLGGGDLSRLLIGQRAFQPNIFVSKEPR